MGDGGGWSGGPAKGPAFGRPVRLAAFLLGSSLSWAVAAAANQAPGVV